MYLKLRNREDGLSCCQHDTECDFVVEHRYGTFDAVQVAYELNADNEEREVRGAVQTIPSSSAWSLPIFRLPKRILPR